MIIYENPNVKLELVNDQEIMIQHWDGYASSENFRLGVDKSVEFIRSKQILGVISDMRTQAVVRPNDANYAAEAMPKAFDDGLKAVAFVVPDSIFTQMSFDKFKANTGTNHTVGYFDSFLEAHRWLKENIA